jgi:carboxymethylenebutenolidase
MVALLMFCVPSRAVPPGEDAAAERIEKSPRHAEYVDVPLGEDQSVRAYVVYPEVKEKAPVVIVIHEIYGLTPWIKSVTDQLAADGFIAIAPDFLSGRGPDGGGTDSFKTRDEVTQAVRAITPEDADRVLNATTAYATRLPAATSRFGVVGYCWGGMQSFRYATTQPGLGAAVVYYGTSPKDGYEKIAAPVLGLYGEDDARVNATVPDAEAKMKSLEKSFTTHTYAGAAHGFLRNQSARDGANKRAADEAWPVTVAFLKRHLAAN